MIHVKDHGKKNLIAIVCNNLGLKQQQVQQSLLPTHTKISHTSRNMQILTKEATKVNCGLNCKRKRSHKTDYF